jgi:hypothetical protein
MRDEATFWKEWLVWQRRVEVVEARRKSLAASLHLPGRAEAQPAARSSYIKLTRQYFRLAEQGRDLLAEHLRVGDRRKAKQAQRPVRWPALAENMTIRHMEAERSWCG